MMAAAPLISRVKQRKEPRKNKTDHSLQGKENSPAIPLFFNLKLIPYRSYRNYLKSKFGKPVLKVPVSGGFSCPNRDGTISSKGCMFCDNVSFSPAALNESSPVDQLLKKCGTGKFQAFLPYLQPFSNTYGSVERLKEVYEPLLAVPGVIGLAIGTRPDCFNESVYKYLESLAGRAYLCVELGLQSSNDKTLERINRGHSFRDFCAAVNRLNKLGIETAAHLMMGLPGESKKEMVQTVKDISELPVNGVKIHQLMVIRGTALEALYKSGELSVLELEDYSQILCDVLPLLRPDQLIHRLMADSRPELGLIAPLWSADKASSMAFIQNRLKNSSV